MKDKERAKRYANRQAEPWWISDQLDQEIHDRIVRAAYLAGLRMGRKLEREGK